MEKSLINLDGNSLENLNVNISSKVSKTIDTLNMCITKIYSELGREESIMTNIALMHKLISIIEQDALLKNKELKLGEEFNSLIMELKAPVTTETIVNTVENIVESTTKSRKYGRRKIVSFRFKTIGVSTEEVESVSNCDELENALVIEDKCEELNLSAIKHEDLDDREAVKQPPIKNIKFKNHIELLIIQKQNFSSGAKHLPYKFTLQTIHINKSNGEKYIFYAKSKTKFAKKLKDVDLKGAEYKEAIEEFNLSIIRRIINLLILDGHKDTLIKLFSKDNDTVKRFRRKVKGSDLDTLYYRLLHKSICNKKVYSTPVCSEFYLNSSSFSHYQTCAFVSMLLEFFYPNIVCTAN